MLCFARSTSLKRESISAGTSARAAPDVPHVA